MLSANLRPPLSLALLCALSLSACAWSFESEPRIFERSRLISPQTTYLVDIYGVPDLSGLEVRVSGTAVTAVLEDRVGAEREGDAEWWYDEVIAVTGVEAGTSEVELLLEGESIGVVEFTVREVNRLVVNTLHGASPRVGDMRYLTAGPLAATAVLSPRAFDADDQPFDGARETTGEAVADDADTVITFQASPVNQSTSFMLDFTAPGTRGVTLLTEAGDTPFAFEAVSPEAVVSLRMVEDEEGSRFTVFGVTADGALVGNLKPVFTVAGRVIAQPDFDPHVWHAADISPRTPVEATWNGLSVSR